LQQIVLSGPKTTSDKRRSGVLHGIPRDTLLLVVILCSACGSSLPGATPPTPVPTTPATPTQSPVYRPAANWIGDATVTAVRRGSGGPCGWGTTIGETRSGVEWNIQMTSGWITLDQDLPNWPSDDLPYSGSVRGTHFEATFYQGDDYLRGACQFRAATITGDFSADFSTFQAVEMLGWGTPEAGTAVERRWVARRVAPQ
jgi:hypothetical protein